MQPSDKVTIARDKVLVSWDIKFIDAGADTIKPQVMVSFSHERAATQMGEKQGEHASAHALGVVLVMQILRDFIPTEITNYAGVTKLADEILLVESRDDFFLNHFKIAHTRSKLLGGLSGEVEAQIDIAEETLDALRKAIDVADGYSMLAPNKLEPATKETVVILKELSGEDAKLPDSQKTAIKEAVTILEGLSVIKTSLLAGQKLAIRRDHSTRVSTLAASRLLEYLNKAPFTAFKRTKKEEGAEADYEKSEGVRVRMALAYLQEVTASPVGLVVSAQVAQADAEAVRKLPPRAAKASAAKAALDKRLEEEQEKIVEAICDLLHYPPIAGIALEPYSDTSVNIANATERTNNLNVLSFVLARHIVMVFATFNSLNDRPDKQKIIDAFIESKLEDWKLPSNMKKKIVTNINKGLGDWDKKGIFNARQDIEDERHVALALDQSVLSLEQSPAKGANLAEVMGVGEEDISHQHGVLFSPASKSAFQPQKLPVVQQQDQSSSQEEKKPSSSAGARLDYKS